MWDSRPPPCALGSTEPVRRKSCTHRLTLASPTLKRRPMSLNDSSPTSYSDTTRQRRSTDTGLGMTFTSPKSDHDSHSSINSRDRRCKVSVAVAKAETSLDVKLRPSETAKGTVLHDLNTIVGNLESLLAQDY